MARKIVRLSPDNLPDLPAPVRSCLFWELDPVQRARADEAGETLSEKQAWLSHVLLEWGSCGRVVEVDGDAAGVVLYAPPVFFPGTASLPTAPIGEDAVQLATAYVAPQYAGGGLGRILMQAMVKDLLSRGDIRAVEAIGSERARRRGQHDCLLPAEFLRRVGFRTQRPHGSYPRMRLELTSVLTWREELERALERLRGVVRPVRVPRPAADSRHARHRG